MTQTRRLTVDELADAVEGLGYELQMHSSVSGREPLLSDIMKRGVPLYVYFRAMQPDSPAVAKNSYDATDPAAMWLWLQFGEDYVNGFDDGFDGFVRPLNPSNSCVRYEHGLVDGRNARYCWDLGVDGKFLRATTLIKLPTSETPTKEPTERLTVEMLDDAIDKTRLRVEDHVWLDTDCGCPMGVFYRANTTASDRMTTHPRDWCAKRFGYDYMKGFIHTFDEAINPGHGDDAVTRRQQGETDGWLARQWFLPIEEYNTDDDID